jgi:hypothetical protein
MANLDPTTVAPKIAQAKSAGYSDDDIVGFLSQAAPDQFKQAKDAGYSASEILGHFASTKPTEPAPPQQGGFWSEVGKAINPIEIGKEIGRTASENLSGVEGAMGRGAKGPIEGLLSTGGAVASAAQLPFSPLVGTLRNIGGHGMTALEHLAGQYINPQVAAKDDLQKMYETARGDVDTALMAARPAGVPIKAPYRGPGLGPLQPPPETALGGPRYADTPGIIQNAPVGELPQSRPAYQWEQPPEPPPPGPPKPPPPGNAVEEAARAENVNVPRAMTSDSWLKQQLGQLLSKQSLVGGAQIGRAIEDVPVQLGARRAAIADEAGARRLPENIGADVRSTIQGAAGTETQAAEVAARQADEAARTNWEQTSSRREQAIAEAEARSIRETNQQVGNAPPTEMGDTIIDTVRANHEAARARKNAAYEDAGAREGTIYDTANSSAHGVVQESLRSDTGRGRVSLSKDTTPVAVDMASAVEDFANRARDRRAAALNEALAETGLSPQEITPAIRAQAAEDAAQTGLSLARVEDFRKDLNAKYANVEKPADRRAANRIMRGFDEWQQRAMGSRYYEGDPEALPSFQRARAANRDLMQRFGYNDRFDEDKIIQKIVRDGRTDHIGPNDVADLLSAKPDKAGRVLDRLYEATGDHPNHQIVQQSIRSGLWNKASAALADGAPRTPAAIAKDVTRLTSGGREGLASRIYAPEDIALMRRHADVLRAAERARTQTADIAKATEPKPTKVESGPAQQLADVVIGSRRSDEQILNVIEGYAKSKDAGDTARLAQVMRLLPEDLKGNVLNHFIRRIGNGPDGKFSAKKFADQWENLPAQRKALLTGNSSEHAKSLDNLVAISRQYDQVFKRFGNPSGSGHILTFAKSLATMTAAMAAGTLLGPVATLGGWLGIAGYSKLLATPQGAASMARFASQMQKFQDTPSLGNAAATRLAARNLRNTAIAIGVHADIPDVDRK